MESFYKLPKLIRLLLFSVLAHLVLLSIMRIIFFAVFNGPYDNIPNSILIKSFYIGLRFDLRLVLLIHFPILLIGWIKPISLFQSKLGQKIWLFYLTFAFKITLLFYIVDFIYFEYLETRLDATILRFFHNFLISLNMVVESYPLGFIVLIFILIISIYWYGLRWLFMKIDGAKIYSLTKWKKTAYIIVFVLVYLFGIYGKFSLYPLRWSNAFFSTYAFASALSINPVLFFFDTLKNKDVKYDIEKVKEYYDITADYLNVTKKDKEKLNFIRINEYDDKPNKIGKLGKPNIVIVLLESFAYYKTGLSKNPLKPTPNFDKIASENSILFTRYYTPHGGTARSVFTAVTGIPDIELVETSSRNPLIVNQHTIINAFKGYDKYYFLGGSANWGEIRGLLSHNIKELQVFEEGSYASPAVDVWGISDLDLFKEANLVLKQKREKPFFAIIHTSGNHKPYTIPKDNENFKTVTADKDEVVKYGFRSVAAFNSFRFMDHSIGFFINIAKKEDYFKNTIFVFIGDHGLIREAKHVHKSENELALSRFHVPLLIYAPELIPELMPELIKEKKIYDKTASEIDLLPTIASLTSTSYINSTFGKNLLDKEKSENYAFTIKHRQNPKIGLIGDNFYFLMNADKTNKRLHQIYTEKPIENVMNKFPDIASKMEKLLTGIYETAKYIRYNNSPQQVKKYAKIHNN
jgi:phosphoglycerol transferase MdoB-like AlkP superfamily enzyme